MNCKNNEPELKLNKIRAENGDKLFIELMRYANTIISFDKPAGTDYPLTMKAKYLFIAMSLYYLECSNTHTPFLDILTIVKTNNLCTIRHIMFWALKKPHQKEAMRSNLEELLTDSFELDAVQKILLKNLNAASP